MTQQGPENAALESPDAQRIASWLSVQGDGDPVRQRSGDIVQQSANQFATCVNSDDGRIVYRRSGD